jgi:NADPH:quinone reductase-like Zn-dependent oxidoreductase
MIIYITMITNLRLTARITMHKVNTQFVNYTPGPPQNMFLDHRDIEVAPGELLLKIKALGINRAECLHRQGKYKINRPIEGLLGLEASG